MNGLPRIRIGREELAKIRGKALRRRVWYRVLSCVERGLVSLTIRCVDQVRSSKLTTMLKEIVGRLREALRSSVDRLMVKVGWPLARRLACLAVSWGNREALSWASDTGFARYLAVSHMNSPQKYNSYPDGED